jgi:hypothetical protein
MKRIGLVLLIGTLILPAVEWDIKQITTTNDKQNYSMILTLDAEGFARVLFGQMDTTLGTYQGDLRVFSNVSGSWEEKIVTAVNDSFSATSERLVVDSKGNTYIGFLSVYDGRIADIWLACDSSGEFELTKLLEDNSVSFDMDMAIDNDDNIHIIYRYGYAFPKEGFTYGYLDNEGFHTEVIIDTIDIRNLSCYDFVVDNDNKPHLFWTGSDTSLYHITQSSFYPSGWKNEKISGTSVGYMGAANISATVDDSNFLHVVCRTTEGIRYVTDKSGNWEEEMISDNPDDYWPVIVVDEDEYVHIMCDAFPSAYYVNSKIGWGNKESVPAGFLPDGDFFVIDASGYGHYTFFNIYPDLTGDIFYGMSSMPLISIKETRIGTPNVVELRNGKICFSISRSSQVTLNLYDASGRRVETIASRCFPPGEHTVPINSAELPRGVYFVRGQFGEYAASAKYVITH